MKFGHFQSDRPSKFCEAIDIKSSAPVGSDSPKPSSAYGNAGSDTEQSRLIRFLIYSHGRNH
eukprot:2656254-Pleurochrysis_carterae.AAC.1